MPLHQLFQPIAVLGIILALLLASRPIIRRLSRPSNQSSSRMLYLRDTVAIDRTRHLTLVECEGQRALVLHGGNTDMLIAWPSHGDIR